MDGDNILEDVCMHTDETKEFDWRDNKCLSDCAIYLSERKVMSDVNFTFKKYGVRKLQAHRLILSMRSAVFEAMFFGPMIDARDGINIEDVEPDIFELVLRYIYTDRTELNGETVLKCLYAARKYCLSGLVKLCSNFLESSISADNVCTIHEQGKFFDVEGLKQKCYTFIIENSADVFGHDDVAKLSYDSLLMLLADERLQSEEILHFKVALRWADSRCSSENIDPSGDNKRKVLGHILSKIRFPVMLPETFAKEVVRTKILSAEEQVQVFQFMVTKATETPGNVGTYSSLPRQGRSLVVDLCNVGSLSTTSAYSNVIKMSSNYDIFLTSIGEISTFRKFSYKCEEDSSLNINFSNNDFVLSDGVLRFKQDTGKEIRLLANKQYTFSFNNHTGYGNTSYTVRKLNHVVAFGEISITITLIPAGVNTITFKRV